MPGSLYSRYGVRELEVLAARGSKVCGEIELAKLRRLAGLLESAAGEVRACLAFRQHGGGLPKSQCPIIDLEYDTTVRLVCQRCLEAVEHHLSACVHLAVLEDAALIRCLPSECEPLVLEGESLTPALLVEDEIILSLPLVPRHEAGVCSVRQSEHLS